MIWRHELTYLLADLFDLTVVSRQMGFEGKVGVREKSVVAEDVYQDQVILTDVLRVTDSGEVEPTFERAVPLGSLQLKIVQTWIDRYLS